MPFNSETDAKRFSSSPAYRTFVHPRSLRKLYLSSGIILGSVLSSLTKVTWALMPGLAEPLAGGIGLGIVFPGFSSAALRRDGQSSLGTLKLGWDVKICLAA